MPSITSKACAKTILFGDHSVVYGFPAIAVPLVDLHLKVTIEPAIRAKVGEVHIIAPAIEINNSLLELTQDSPIRKSIEYTRDFCGATHIPACTIHIKSDFPTSSGLGSSAACAIALIRSVSNFLGRVLKNEQVNRLAFEIEKIQHGNPSGIDNTVITFEKPVYFEKNKTTQLFSISHQINLILAYCGIKGETRQAIELVAQKRKAEMERYQSLFNEIGKIAETAYDKLLLGDLEKIGLLMNQNHNLLHEMGVSIPILDKLVETAKRSGALGAKLCGGGLGGNIVALVHPQNIDSISAALSQAGATWIHSTHVG
jgi:mevalonate kinase